jgi:hypothetical protein
MHPVDLYCERISPGLLAEPFNSASNAAFFIAAWLLWRFARENGSLSAATWLLIVLVATIGAGSTLFHLFATEETRSLDLLPILVFQLVFLWYYARRVVAARLPCRHWWLSCQLVAVPGSTRCSWVAHLPRRYWQCWCDLRRRVSLAVESCCSLGLLAARPPEPSTWRCATSSGGTHPSGTC